jgi:hypothetical protein
MLVVAAAEEASFVAVCNEITEKIDGYIQIKLFRVSTEHQIEVCFLLQKQEELLVLIYHNLVCLHLVEVYQTILEVRYNPHHTSNSSNIIPTLASKQEVGRHK